MRRAKTADDAQRFREGNRAPGAHATVVGLSDHLPVALEFVRAAFRGLAYVLWIPVSPVLAPLLRRRRRRALSTGPGPLYEPPPPEPALWEGRTIFVSAGEPSGDRLAARVVEAVLRRCPGVAVRGLGGPALAAAGARLDREITGYPVTGVIPVLRTLGTWWRICAEAHAIFRAETPAAILTVDYPGLNVVLARWARRRGARAVHLVPPAVWAYGPWRSRRWGRAVDLMLAVLPFEEVLLARSGLPCRFVGHPLFEAPLPPPRTGEDWPGAGPCTVELLPGSRPQELRRHSAFLLEAAAVVARRLPEAEFVVRLSSASHAAAFDEAAGRAKEVPRGLRVVTGAWEGAPLLGALASSGTVTAELAVDLVPMAVIYRTTFLARLGAPIYLTVPWIALANLLAGREVVPERILPWGGRPVDLAAAVLSVAGTREAWARTREALLPIRRTLAVDGVADRVARALLAQPQPSTTGVGNPG